MTKISKPAVVPTLLSSRSLAWSLVLVAAFLVLWWLYSAYGRLESVRAELRRATKTHVVAPPMSANVPAGWAAYSLTPREFRMYRQTDSRLPLIEINIDRANEHRFRALDRNPAVVLNLVQKHLAWESRYKETEPKLALTGLEVVLVKPGVQGIHFVFKTEDGLLGEGVEFFLGDIRYMVWGLAERADAAALADIGGFVGRIFDEIDLPDIREDFERPVIHSGNLTAEDNRRTLEEAEREVLMWKLFAKRAETEGQTALLPAIQHFRNAVRLLSSIRRERAFVESDEYERYRRLMKVRRDDVRKWFVLLDKYRAMRDYAAARRQAAFIFDHVTLVGEGTDRRRAADALANLPAD